MKNRKGFTLMELAIVMAIIGILAAVMVPVTRGYLETAKRKAAQLGVNQLAAAMATAFSNRPANQNWTPQDVLDNLHLNTFGGQYIEAPAAGDGYVVQLSGPYYRIMKSVPGVGTYYSSWQLPS